MLRKESVAYGRPRWCPTVIRHEQETWRARLRNGLVIRSSPQWQSIHSVQRGRNSMDAGSRLMVTADYQGLLAVDDPGSWPYRFQSSSTLPVRPAADSA